MDCYVLLIQCEQVFYSEVPGRVGWSHVVRYDPSGRLMEYNVAEEDDNVEEDDGVKEKLINDNVSDHKDVEEV